MKENRAGKLNRSSRNRLRIVGLLRVLPLALSLYLLTAQYGFGQEQAKTDFAQRDTFTYSYRQFTTGVSRPIFRDFTTSPLFYKGFGLDLQSAWLKRSEEFEHQFEIGLSFNRMSADIPESSFIQPSAVSFLGQLNIRYVQLRTIDILPDTKYNFKAGGSVQSTQNVRINNQLQNNLLGLENFSNLMASGQVTRDISRKRTRELKRKLRFQFNAGILNFNYRPGYAYTYDSEINGLETNPVNWIFSDYSWSLNGWRFSTELEYITFLPNGNIRSWAYVWDAMNAPGRYEAFQMASHQIRYSIYFHTKKR